MSGAARSVAVFGVYCAGVGLILIAAPNIFLGAVGLPPTGEPYIRVLGVVVLVLALYYLAAARAEAVAFFRWTTWGRPMAFMLFGALALLGFAPRILVLFGAVDAVGALWTATALRRQFGARAG